MAFSLLYLAVRALLGALVRSRRGLHVKDVELLVLRHELEILRRQDVRPKLRMVDRGLLAATACYLPRSSRATLLVTPRTILRWHQAIVRRKWRQPEGRRGRPRQGEASDIEIQARETIALKRRMEQLIAQHSGQPLEKVSKDWNATTS